MSLLGHENGFGTSNVENVSEMSKSSFGVNSCICFMFNQYDCAR